MDESGFDRLARGLARDLTRAGSRRGLFAGLAALLTGGGLTGAVSDVDAAPVRGKRRRAERRDGNRASDTKRQRDADRPDDADRAGAHGQRGRKRRGCLKDGTRCTAKSGRKGDNCQRCCSGFATPRPGGGRRCACRQAAATCQENRQCCSKQCFEGVCLDCATGETTCPGAGCVDLQTDADHCGTCGTACGANRACVAGVCVANCGSGQTLCGDDCVNLQSDDANCGTCDITCGADETCAAGDCACDPGLDRCGDDCVNLQTNDANCGACGTVCGSNASCVTGDCACDSGFTACGDACVNLQTDDNNCDACGNDCPGYQTCTNGVCVDRACGAGGPCTVFVTSSIHTANLGGLAGADAICQGLADGADLPGTYYAWLSTSTTSPERRFVKSTGPYRLPDGTAIAANWTDLTDNNLASPISLTEENAPLPTGSTTNVWTITRTNGQSDADVNFGTCNDWTSTDGRRLSAGGVANQSNFQWTQGFIGAPCSTSYQYHLYCFQQS